MLGGYQKSTMQAIDDAFDQTLREAENDTDRPRKRQRTESAVEDTMAGGFLLDDDEEATDSREIDAEEMPLSLIPRALQLLDLSPDDAEVTEVFKNAAFERQSAEPNDPDNGGLETVVSREDWRAVCLTLLPEAVNELETEEVPDMLSSPSSEDYDDDSAEEYVPDGRRRKQSAAPRSSNRKSRRVKKRSEDDSYEDTKKKSLTVRQRRDALSSFALFFPDLPKTDNNEVSERDLVNRRLTAEDIAQASKSINDKISSDEVCCCRNQWPVMQ